MEIRNDGGNESVFFPYDPNVIQATSGRVTGVLSKSDKNSPSANGAMIYELTSLQSKLKPPVNNPF